MASRQIRQQFLDFFAAKGHAIVDSSPVVPHDDPTLLFTNAGMNQFKDVFLAAGSRAYKRAADTQKCIRAGGKHNDLDDVGQDTYHHTFFEMLGNWSFGDYFKREAIAWAWELLTEVWAIDKDRLHATYFEGDKAEGLEPDTEAAQLWRSVTDIDASHVHPGGKKDNIWEMGETGPCGPCSEIHVDLTPDKSGASLVNAGDARVIELWNLVFIQFNRAPDGTLSPLPAKHVDTGMGFERLCAVLLGAERGQLGQISNYDTDVFAPIFEAIQKRTGAPPYTGTLPDDDSQPRRDREEVEPEPQDSACAKQAESEGPPPNASSRGRKPAARKVGSAVRTTPNQLMIDVSYRVIADHLRCLTFALTDGAYPSNEGRGYVLRRILRRAVRYARQYLNMHEPFLCDLVKPFVNLMADPFPELRTAHGGKNVQHVTELIRDEEASFLKTLDRGIRLLDEAVEEAIVEASDNGWTDRPPKYPPRIRGEVAFRLYDTYGFPIDLTEQMAEERGLTVDIAEYERLMEEARARARASHSEIEVLSEALRIPKEYLTSTTNDLPKYLLDSIQSTYLFPTGVLQEDGQDLWTSQGLIGFVFETTCFYGEQGGQVGDQGYITFERTPPVRVATTKRSGNLVIHLVDPSTLSGEPPIRSGQTAILSVDKHSRARTKKNHTATHLLNWALREVLGDHIQQKGSLVDPEKTRFDFSHNKPVTNDELARIESLVNERIEQNLTVYAPAEKSDYVDQPAAQKIRTLRAVFGEKYPDRVRVVSIGVPITENDAALAGEADWLLKSPESPEWMNYAVEFCGGTHLKNTSEAEDFVLTSEEAVAKGIRRIVGVTGETARRARARGEELLAEARELADADRLADFQQNLSNAVIPIHTRQEIQQVVADAGKKAREQQKESAAASGDLVLERVTALLKEAETIAGVTVVAGEVPAAPPDALRRAIDWVRSKTEASAVFLAMADGGKVTLVAGMSKAVVKKGIKAGDLIKEIAPLVGGRGGGRPDMAQGGGNDSAAISEAIEAAKGWIRGKLS